jgi:hypothetical protein
MIPPHQRGQKVDEQKLKWLEKLYQKTNYVQLNEADKISITDIEDFINNSRNVQLPKVENEEALFEHFKDDFIKTNEHFLVYFKEILDESEANDISESVHFSLQHADYFSGNRLNKYLHDLEQEARNNHLVYVWFNLSILTSPHEQMSRYPSAGKTLEELYSADNLLIKYFLGLTSVLEQTIKLYEELYFPEST